MKWKKIVSIIIVLELVIGGGIFLYKKLGPTKDDKNITKDKEIQQLYNKIAHEDIEFIDIMKDEAKLYYGYHNVTSEQTINCDVVNIEKDTTGYQCNKLATFVPKDMIINAVKQIYGKDISVELIDFKVDEEHYAFFDSEASGYVIYESLKQSDVAPINIKLQDAKKKDNQIILTTEVLDGIYGTTVATYIYTFEKDEQEKEYNLIKKEKLST